MRGGTWDFVVASSQFAHHTHRHAWGKQQILGMLQQKMPAQCCKATGGTFCALYLYCSSTSPKLNADMIWQPTDISLLYCCSAIAYVVQSSQRVVDQSFIRKPKKCVFLRS